MTNDLEVLRLRLENYIAEMKCLAAPDWAALTNFLNAQFALMEREAAQGEAVGEVSDGFSGADRGVTFYKPVRYQPAPGTKLYTALAPPVSAAPAGEGIDLNWRLPCDVKVAPATTIRKGCKLSTLLTCIRWIHQEPQA